MRSTYPSCSTSAAVDNDKPKRNVRRSDEPLRAIPKGMYKRILFKKSGAWILLSIYLSEGWRSATGIIVVTTIRAIEGASRRRHRRGGENSFKGRWAQGQYKCGESSQTKFTGRDFSSLRTVVALRTTEARHRRPQGRRGT